MSRVRRYFTETVTLQPGESVVRSIRTAFVTCLEATGAFKIAIDDEGFSEFGQGLTLTLDTPSRQVWLLNASGAVNTVQLAYGENGVRDQRLNVSAPVSVIDGFGRALSDARVFTRNKSLAAAAGESPYIELANPAGSGILITVTGIRIAVNTNMTVVLYAGDDATPLANQFDSLSSLIKSGGVVTQGAGKIRSESSGVSKVFPSELATFLITTQAPVARQISYQLEPNSAIRAYATGGGTNLEFGAQWIEEPI